MSDRPYAVEFTSSARKQLKRLDRAVQQRVLMAAALLGKHPRPPAARRLTSSNELWRVRLGDYRIVYSIDEDGVVVVVVRVGHRSAVYRDIG